MIDEKEKVIRLVAMDNKTWTEVKADNDKILLNLAYGITKSWEKAEDVRGEVYEKFLMCVGTFECKCLISSFLYRITINEAVELMRKEGCESNRTFDIDYLDEDGNAMSYVIMECVEYLNPESILENIQIGEAIEIAVHNLPDHQCRVISFWLVGETDEDIKDLMNLDGRRQPPFTIDMIKKLKINGKIALIIALKDIYQN